MKYLDETGLSHFWNKIKANIPDDYISNSLDTVSDCNDITLETGFYYCVGETANVPYESAWFLQVMKELVEEKLLVITQIAYKYRDNEIWIRQYNHVSSTGWKEWSQVYPTGIIESGSNSNGSYTKYPDGTMICRGKATCSAEIKTAAGSLYRPTNAQKGYFPAEFKDGDITINLTAQAPLNIAYLSSYRTSSFEYYPLSYGDRTADDRYVHYTAIGRWK